MATGLESWSTTASSNATADANVNWAEGQTPGSVNNSARAEMASMAMWRNDNRGTITTGGTSTAFTATSAQTITLSDGVTITLQMSATSGASPTLNVDSTGAKAIQGVSGTAIATGALLSGGVYTFVYRSSPDAWIVKNRYAPNEFAGGSVVSILFYQNTAPTGWTINTTNTDDRAIRLVSGSGAGGGTGGALAGTTAFTSIMAARTIAANQLPNITLTTTDPGHTHTVAVSVGNANDGGGSAGSASSSATTSSSSTTGVTCAIDNTARGGVAQQTIDFAVKYASVIVASKD